LAFHYRAHRSRSVGVTVLDATVVIAITPAVPAMIWPGTVTAVASPVRITFATRSVTSALTSLKLVMCARRPVWLPE
jgi:hypothetical protein